MEESRLTQVFNDSFGQLPSEATIWSPLGFLRNPYPTKSHPIWNVFHNQNEVRERFYKDLTEFVRASRTTTMFFTGGNRVGKTHFMEHHRRALPEELWPRAILLPIAVARAESASLFQLYLEIVEQVSETFHQQTGGHLFEPSTINPESLPVGDFQRAAKRLAASTTAEVDFLRGLFSTWIRGGRLRANQRQKLDVVGLVETQAQLLNAFGALVQHLRNLKSDSLKCPGILVFVDEFELVWRVRRDRRDQFLQGLRAMVDQCAEHGGLFLCVALATGIGPDLDDLERDYPALFARLTGAREIPALVEIESAVVAIEYARRFEAVERDRYLAKHPDDEEELPSSALFTDREIDGFFRDAQGAAPGASVTQADLFDRLHNEAEEIVNQDA